VELEAQQREENAHQKRLRLAKFPVVKTMDQFDFTCVPSLNKAKVLSLAQGYERQSLIVTTNLEFSQWPQVFGSEQLTGALLDRLTHHSHILAMNGESFRFRESLKNMRSEGCG
jgi:DNA replication protein DnaC